MQVIAGSVLKEIPQHLLKQDTGQAMTKLWPICQWLLALFDIRFLPVSWPLLMLMGSYCICCWVHPLLVGGFVAGVIKIYPAVLMASGKIHHLVRWFYRCFENVWMIFHEVRKLQVSLLVRASSLRSPWPTAPYLRKALHRPLPGVCHKRAAHTWRPSSLPFQAHPIIVPNKQT